MQGCRDDDLRRPLRRTRDRPLLDARTPAAGGDHPVRAAHRPVGVPPLQRAAPRGPAGAAGVRWHAGGLGDRPVLLPGRPSRRLPVRAPVGDSARFLGATAAPGPGDARGHRVGLRPGEPRLGPDRNGPTRPRSHPDPVRAHRPAGTRPDDDDPAGEWLVRGGAGARDRRRPVLALRLEQRRVAPGLDRLPVGHRAASRARGTAWGLGGRLRGARRAPGGRRFARDPGAARSCRDREGRRRTRQAIGGGRSARRSTGAAEGAGSCSPRSRRGCCPP